MASIGVFGMAIYTIAIAIPDVSSNQGMHCLFIRSIKDICNTVVILVMKIKT